MTDRPWSAAEVEQEIPRLMDQLDDAWSGHRTKTIDAATAKRDHRREEAKAWLRVSGKNAEERKARVYLMQIEPGGKTVGDLEYLADIAEGEARSEAMRIKTLTTRADLLRSLLVSSRAVT